jgi:hypothetical protein
MPEINFQISTTDKASLNLEEEIAHTEKLIAERSAELKRLQTSLSEFRALYMQTVGKRLAELAEIEREIKRLEAEAFGIDEQDSEDEPIASDDARRGFGSKTLRKLFWSAAKLFHPDHAKDEREAARRHALMSEATRAYRAGDVESLQTLVGDEDFNLYCATLPSDGEAVDSHEQLLRLKDELRTIEFGIKRITQDGLYRIKLKADEAAREGKNLLDEMAQNISRQIIKARRKLEHLS